MEEDKILISKSALYHLMNKNESLIIHSMEELEDIVWELIELKEQLKLYDVEKRISTKLDFNTFVKTLLNP